MSYWRHRLSGQVQETLPQRSVVGTAIRIVSQLPVEGAASPARDGEARAHLAGRSFRRRERGIRARHHVAVEIFVESLPVHRCRGHGWRMIARALVENNSASPTREAQTPDPVRSIASVTQRLRYRSDEGEIATQDVQDPSAGLDLRQAASAAEA